MLMDQRPEKQPKTEQRVKRTDRWVKLARRVGKLRSGASETDAKSKARTLGRGFIVRLDASSKPRTDTRPQFITNEINKYLQKISDHSISGISWTRSKDLVLHVVTEEMIDKLASQIADDLAGMDEAIKGAVRTARGPKSI